MPVISSFEIERRQRPVLLTVHTRVGMQCRGPGQAHILVRVVPLFAHVYPTVKAPRFVATDGVNAPQLYTLKGIANNWLFTGFRFAFSDTLFPRSITTQACVCTVIRAWMDNYTVYGMRLVTPDLFDTDRPDDGQWLVYDVGQTEFRSILRSSGPIHNWRWTSREPHSFTTRLPYCLGIRETVSLH